MPKYVFSKWSYILFVVILHSTSRSFTNLLMLSWLHLIYRSQNLELCSNSLKALVNLTFLIHMLIGLSMEVYLWPKLRIFVWWKLICANPSFIAFLENMFFKSCLKINSKGIKTFMIFTLNQYKHQWHNVWWTLLLT